VRRDPAGVEASAPSGFAIDRAGDAAPGNAGPACQASVQPAPLSPPCPTSTLGLAAPRWGRSSSPSLRSDDAQLALTNLGPVTCPLAETFAAWARFGVDRAAQQILGSPLVRIETMGSYNCRNVAGSDRRSAHATANAIDIAAFVLADGRRITITGDWHGGTPAERQFLTAIHSSACKRFGTVLGPAYNAAHRDHLHLELVGQLVLPLITTTPERAPGWRRLKIRRQPSLGR